MDNMKMPPMGMPEGGPGGPGGPGPGKGPMIRLAAEYTLDFLAPSGVPRKYLHVNLEAMTAILDTEHGTQDCQNFKYEDGAISFNAMLGSNGDEFFKVVAKLYGGGVMLGEAFIDEPNMPKSPVVFKEVE